MIVVIMTTSGILSAIMNNVAVAALMLPVVMDIARHTHIAPSRLLNAPCIRLSIRRNDHPDRNTAKHPGH
jgi:Na+/H+ antiporter NhaD/arsenite permease-like protein